uniref:Uncharacterized protein n=1 Tax=Ciona savignyi TaxID=51511 RepID=H2YCS9_CIOSA
MFLEWVSSNTIMSGLIGLITLIMIVYYYWWKLPHLRYPPGVRGIPILGALPFLGRFPGKVIKEWSLKKYGPVMSVRFGPNESVVLNDFESIHEALVKHRSIFQGRPTLKLIEDYSHGYGYGFADGHKKLLDVRNFTAKVLRGFGIGRRE